MGHKSLLIILLLLIILGVNSSAQAEISQMLVWEENIESKATLILINGFKADFFQDGPWAQLLARHWESLASTIATDLDLEGYFDIYIFTYQPLLGSMDQLAVNLAQALQTVAKPQQDIYFIAHSMGGILARHYLNYYLEQKTEQIKALFTLGTPHQGIPFRALSENIAGNIAPQLLEGTTELMLRFGYYDEDVGEYLEQLNTIDQYKDRYYSIFGLQLEGLESSFLAIVARAFYDLVTILHPPTDSVVPNFSSYLPGAKNFPPIRNVDHNNIYESEKAFEIIVNGLKSMLFAQEFPVEIKIVDNYQRGVAGKKVFIDGQEYISDQNGKIVIPLNLDFATKIKGEDFYEFSPSFHLVDGRTDAYVFTYAETVTVKGELKELFTGHYLRAGYLLMSCLEDYENFFYTAIDETGTFYFENIPPGEYRFAYVLNERRSNVYQGVTVKNKDIDITLYLLPGRMFDED